ncbi:MAG: hypothetical protein J6Z09_03715 [Lachnospiraceae bacterium]|nr:hypothetical protein [Lachnospiraceae bacterium]
MGFTRQWLNARGYEKDQQEELIGEHIAVVNALKTQLADVEAKLEAAESKVSEYDKVKDELKMVKQNLKDTTDKLTAAEKDRDEYKSKSETTAADIEKLKSDYEAKETASKKENALRTELKNGKYSDEAMTVIFDSKKDYASKIEFGEDGKATNLADILSEITTAYPQYTPTQKTTGTNPATPPANGGGNAGMTWDEIDKIKDPEQRQLAMAKNMKSLGIGK